MALRALWGLLLISMVTGCGPRLSPTDLPVLPDVATGHFLEAVSDQLDGLHQAVVANPLDAKKTGKLGMAYLAYHLDEAAEIALRRARMLQPRKFDWMYYHARALARLGRLPEAMILLRQANDRKSYGPAQTQLGLLAMQLGQLQLAQDTLQAIVDKNPANAQAHLALAQVHLRADEPHKATLHLNYLIDEIRPAGAVYFALADVARRTGDNEKAGEYLALFEKYRNVSVAVDDPLLGAVFVLDQSEKPLLSLARRLNQQGRTDDAMKVLHRALTRNPHSDLTHAALVGAYGAMKQFDKVDEHYRLALESAPATAPLLRNLGRARFYENRIAEARQAFEQALEINPHDSSALAWLGLAHIKQKDLAGGVELLNKALAENPHESLARHNLVNILRQQGRHEEALVHIRQLLIVEDKHSPRLWREMAQSYLILESSGDARNALNKSVASAKRQNNDDEARKSTMLLHSMTQ